MTEKTLITETTPKVEVAVKAKKAPARKPAAKKAAPKKVAPKKAAVRKAPEKSVFEKLEDSVIALPFKAANKTFLASLGLLSVVQKEVEERFDEIGTKFDKYAKDGEKVLDEYEHKFEDIRKEVVEQVYEARDKVRERFGKAA